MILKKVEAAQEMLQYFIMITVEQYCCNYADVVTKNMNEFDNLNN